MKVTCIQMDMLFGELERNYRHGKALIEQAMEDKPDVIVLPETWTTGFFPKRNPEAMCDHDGKRLQEEIGSLAARYNVNIVAGSVANIRDGKVYNSAYVFDRTGTCIASYDKTHLFTPSREETFCTPGDHLCRFTLDGVSCGLIICYDIRFPELTRSLAVPGMDMLFVVAQWPSARTFHLRSLTIETDRSELCTRLYLPGVEAPLEADTIAQWGVVSRSLDASSDLTEEEASVVCSVVEVLRKKHEA